LPVSFVPTVSTPLWAARGKKITPVEILPTNDLTKNSKGGNKNTDGGGLFPVHCPKRHNGDLLAGFFFWYDKGCRRKMQDVSLPKKAGAIFDALYQIVKTPKINRAR